MPCNEDAGQPYVNTIFLEKKEDNGDNFVALQKKKGMPKNDYICLEPDRILKNPKFLCNYLFA